MNQPLPSLGTRLAGAFAKVRRADQHIRGLRRSLERFSRRDPYSLGARQHDSGVVMQAATLQRIHSLPVTPSGLVLPPRLTTRMLARTFMASVTLTPRPRVSAPLLKWGIAIGEIVHNLASALDNLVFELAETNPNPPPPPRNAAERTAHRHARSAQGFPYCTDRARWSETVQRNIFFVDRAMDSVFEEVQPFFARERRGVAPEYHPLWLLHELWNRDKHRTVNVATSAATLEDAYALMPDLFPDHPDLPARTVQTFPSRPIQGTTEVAYVLVELPRQITVPTNVQMHMKARFSLTILLGSGAPGEGQNALDVLMRARDEIAGILNRFE
jgi:hypothetical protein